jgi:hypothetical protein
VVTQNPDLANRVEALFAGFATTDAPTRLAHVIQVTGVEGKPHRLYKGCSLRGSGESGEELLPILVAVVNRAAIDSAKWFAVHAAVVGVVDRVIALPADSGGGKSTLAAAAVLSGFSYLSDEALVLNDHGAVIPYPKPIALSAWSCDALGLGRTDGERLFTIEELGGRARLHTARLTDLVVANYRTGPTVMTRAPSSYAVADLIAKSFNHYKDPERAFRLATLAARDVKVWKLDYDDPRNAIEWLRSTLS